MQTIQTVGKLLLGPIAGEAKDAYAYQENLESLMSSVFSMEESVRLLQVSQWPIQKMADDLHDAHQLIMKSINRKRRYVLDRGIEARKLKSEDKKLRKKFDLFMHHITLKDKNSESGSDLSKSSYNGSAYSWNDSEKRLYFDPNFEFGGTSHAQGGEESEDDDQNINIHSTIKLEESSGAKGSPRSKEDIHSVISDSYSDTVIRPLKNVPSKETMLKKYLKKGKKIAKEGIKLAKDLIGNSNKIIGEEYSAKNGKISPEQCKALTRIMRARIKTNREERLDAQVKEQKRRNKQLNKLNCFGGSED